MQTRSSEPSWARTRLRRPTSTPRPVESRNPHLAQVDDELVAALADQVDDQLPQPRRGIHIDLALHVDDAQRVLAARTRSATRDEAAEWLEHARQAIERRNAALHAAPIVWVGRERAEDRLGLGEMPRKGRPISSGR